MTATAPAFTFDRLTYVDRLRNDAGLDERTARAHADALDHAIRESVATKADIAEVKDEIERVEASLKADIAQVENGLKDIDRRIDVLEAGVRAEFAAVRGDITAVRGEIAASSATQLRWLIGTLITLGIAIVGAVWILLRTAPPGIHP